MDELRRIRKERGLSQQRLAELAKVDKVTIVHIEGGKVSPKVETLKKLATALEVEVADFFPKAQAPLPFEVHTAEAHLSGTGTLKATGEVIKKIRLIADELADGKDSGEAAQELEEQARKLRTFAA